jgi:hypothetical protein
LESEIIVTVQIRQMLQIPSEDFRLVHELAQIAQSGMSRRRTIVVVYLDHLRFDVDSQHCLEKLASRVRIKTEGQTAAPCKQIHHL